MVWHLRRFRGLIIVVYSKMSYSQVGSWVAKSKDFYIFANEKLFNKETLLQRITRQTRDASSFQGAG